MSFSNRSSGHPSVENAPPPWATATLSIRPTLRRSGNLLLDLPIASRLTIGFLIAGLIATIAAGITGFQRSQSLSKQSDFYQSLLQTNTSLTTGENFLQLMNTETHTTLNDASMPAPSRETLTLDCNAVQDLTNRYDAILTQYLAHTLLNEHPDEVALLAEANHSVQIVQQQTLADSALRTWRLYHKAQTQTLQDIATGNIAEAQQLERLQGEPTQADALSALRALIQFDERLSTSVQDAANVEQQSQLITTIIDAILAFIGIALVGLFISNTIVKRLRQLHQVTQAVEQGQLDARVQVVGRDEIADVSASVNAMITAIVGLLEETRRQRDALTNAAVRLFSDMRVVSSGDLRVNAAVQEDPIGMLANAFNFTVGRFQRFALRTQEAVERLDVIARHEHEHADAFLRIVSTHSQASAQEPPITPNHPASPFNTLQARTISGAPITGGFKEPVQDVLRAGARFAQEVQAHAHQLSSLARQIHTNIVSFQLEKVNIEGSSTASEKLTYNPKTPPVPPPTPSPRETYRKTL